MKIPLPDTMKNRNIDDIAVYHVADDGEVDTIESSVSDGFVSFKTTHFSIFVVAETKISDAVIEDDNAPKTTISFNANGGKGTMEICNAKINSTIALPTCSFTRDGYTFAGWSYSQDGAVVFVDGSGYPVGEQPNTLYAVWTANTNTIIFNANGGQGTMQPQTMKTDETANLNTCLFTRDGYIFVGWSTDLNDTVEYNDKAQYTMGIYAGYTLHAVWSKSDYKISYYLNGGENSAQNPNGFNVDTATITLKAPTKHGYTFKGWYKESTFNTIVTSIPKGTSANVTLYAKWEATKYTITYTGANGLTNTNPATYTIETQTITLSDISKTGYIFEGWYKNGNEVTTIEKGTTGNITLTAKWKIGTINYNTSKTSIKATDTITPTLFGASCPVSGATVKVKEIIGTQTAGATISVKLEATASGVSPCEITVSGIKVYGTPTITYNGEPVYASTDLSTVITAADSFGKALTVYFNEQDTRVENGTFKVTATATDHIGNSTSKDFTLTVSIGNTGTPGLHYGYWSETEIMISGYSGTATDIVIPSTYNGKPVTMIETVAFMDCTKLTSVTFEEDSKLTSIYSYAFLGCTGLTSISIPSSVTYIGEDAFSGCTGLIQKENGISYVDKWVIDCDDSVTEMSLRAGTVGIADYAFYKCTGLTSVTIPNSVTSIGSYAFYNCTRLTSINFLGTQEQWNAITKGTVWDEDTGDYTITCTDGTI